MRSEAAVSLGGIGVESQDLPDVLAQLAQERHAATKLSWALSLRQTPGAESAVRDALEAISRGTGMPALQATLELAAHGDTSARTRLRAAMEPSSANTFAGVPTDEMQRVTFRGVAQVTGDAHALRPWLDDAQNWRRMAAAGAVLVAACVH